MLLEVVLSIEDSFLAGPRIVAFSMGIGWILLPTKHAAYLSYLGIVDLGPKGRTCPPVKRHME